MSKNSSINLLSIPRPVSKQPLPEDAKKVFKGTIFSVYQWPQKMFDGSVATFEKLQRNDTVGILPVTPDKKIIVCKQEQPSVQPFSGLLGGIVDPGEQPLVAAQRELREESGLESNDWNLWFTSQPTSKIDWAVFMFIARNCQIVGKQQLESGEKIELVTLEYDEFLDFIFLPEFRDSEVTLKIARMLHLNQQDQLKKLIFGE